MFATVDFTYSVTENPQRQSIPATNIKNVLKTRMIAASVIKPGKYQGRIQDLKLGVAQMDWIEKFEKLGVGV